MSTTLTRRVFALTVACAGLASCASVDVPESLPGPTTPSTEAAPPAGEVDCGNPVASLTPDGPASAAVPDGSYMAEIQARGRLRVGVDVATLQLGSVDPLTGEFEGFDVDIAREVADALLPDVAATNRVEFVGIPSSDRSLALTGEGAVQVDMVASAFTINCERREQIEFSSEYYHAGQRVLVRSDSPAAQLSDAPAEDVIRQLGEAGATVCASAGSTAIDNIEGLGLAEAPDIEPAPGRADCLVRLQQGDTDAMVTDDAILAGMAAQDPNLVVVPEMQAEPLSDEPYGLGLPPGRPEWVRYVNAVLDDVRSSGRWNQIYDEWLAPVLGPGTGPPSPVHEG
ncbi:MAG: glutamate ABC transporter substrate-binding protein [Acidimicrobiales bacterium]